MLKLALNALSKYIIIKISCIYDFLGYYLVSFCLQDDPNFTQQVKSN